MRIFYKQKGEYMDSKHDRIVQKNLKLHEGLIKKSNDTEEFSLAEEVFSRLQFHSEGFKPNFFTSKNLAVLSLTSKTLRNFALPEQNLRAAQKLLTHVILGEQIEAETMIKHNPELLLIKSRSKDYANRTIIATPFQAAIGAGDKPMWSMILPYFKDLEKTEASQQFQEQFPNEIKDEISADKLIENYNKIALAIINDDNSYFSLMEKFRKEFTLTKVIKQGSHFNLQHLIAAYQAFINNLNNFNTQDKKDLFFKQIIGYVQRQLTAYDAQILCSGIKKVLDDETFFERKLDLYKGKVFFPLIDNSGLGYDFACISYFEGEAKEKSILPANVAGGWRGVIKLLSKLDDTKTKALSELERTLCHNLSPDLYF
ncbi:MAG: hypothetical protein Q8M40_05210 [Legionella sp.]|nr:hypothetical protein [Legionella sp.]